MSDTRQEIINVAIEHFSVLEYQMVNLEEIARDAHITRAPLYYYFKNKEGLYRAVVEATLIESREKMDAILSKDEDIFEVIRKEYLYCVQGLGKYRKIWNPSPGAPDCKEQISEFYQWLLDRKLELCNAAKRDGKLSSDCDTSELVTLIYVFYDGVLDTKETAMHHIGLNNRLLDHSEEWFMEIIKERFGKA